MTPSSDAWTVTQIFTRFRQGDPSAAGQLVELLYPELRRIAANHMKGSAPGTRSGRPR